MVSTIFGNRTKVNGQGGIRANGRTLPIKGPVREHIPVYTRCWWHTTQETSRVIQS